MPYAKLGMKSAHRKAVFRNMVTSLFKEERIETTAPRAREVKSIADKMITLAKRGDLHARRQVLAYLQEEDVVRKLFDQIAPRYADRQGGYTRVIRKGEYRRGDAAEMVILELV